MKISIFLELQIDVEVEVQKAPHLRTPFKLVLKDSPRLQEIRGLIDKICEESEGSIRLLPSPVLAE